MNTLKKMYWWNGPKMRSKRIRGERKATRLEMDVIKKINAAVEELAKRNDDDGVMHEPTDCAKWQWDLLMEQELQSEKGT